MFQKWRTQLQPVDVADSEEVLAVDQVDAEAVEEVYFIKFFLNNSGILKKKKSNSKMDFWNTYKL